MSKLTGLEKLNLAKQLVAAKVGMAEAKIVKEKLKFAKTMITLKNKLGIGTNKKPVEKNKEETLYDRFVNGEFLKSNKAAFLEVLKRLTDSGKDLDDLKPGVIRYVEAIKI